MAPGAADPQIGPTDPGDFDQLTQCLIQAPSNRPYFLLLQGYQDAQVSTVCPMERALCSTLRLKGNRNYNSRIPWVMEVSVMLEGVVPERQEILSERIVGMVDRGSEKILGQVGNSLLHSKLGESSVFLKGA